MHPATFELCRSMASEPPRRSVRAGGPADGAAGADAASSSDDNSSVEQGGGGARRAAPPCPYGPLVPGRGPGTGPEGVGSRRKRARVGSLGSVTSQRLRAGMAAAAGPGAAAAEAAQQPGAPAPACGCPRFQLGVCMSWGCVHAVLLWLPAHAARSRWVWRFRLL